MRSRLSSTPTLLRLVCAPALGLVSLVAACSGNAAGVTTESNPTLVVVGQDVLAQFNCLDAPSAGAGGASSTPRSYQATLVDVSGEYGAAGVAGAAAAELEAPTVLCGRETGFNGATPDRRYTTVLRFFADAEPAATAKPLFTVRCGEGGLPDALGVDEDGQLVTRNPSGGAALGPVTAVIGATVYVRACVRQ